MNPAELALQSAGEKIIFILPNWKWIALSIALLSGYFVKSFAKLVFSKIQKNSRLQSNFHPLATKILNCGIKNQVGTIVCTVFWFLAIDLLELPPLFNKYLELSVKIITSYHLMILIYKMVDSTGFYFEELYTTKNDDKSLRNQLIPFATKTLKVFVLVLGGLILMQSFGINVMSLLAGLGLGGLALALAAQDTAANLFGSITILLDTPFKVGDWIKVGDTEGTVEEVGFRSTRIRTFYQSLITVPNSTIAKEKIDNMGSRPLRRIRHVLGLSYETSPEQIKSFCEQIKSLIQEHPLSDKNTYSVYLTAYSASSLDVTINFFINAPNGDIELSTQQEFLLNFWNLAQELKINYAFPTQTLYIKNKPVSETLS
jgi:MscS family membrane protein